MADNVDSAGRAVACKWGFGDALRKVGVTDSVWIRFARVEGDVSKGDTVREVWGQEVFGEVNVGAGVVGGIEMGEGKGEFIGEPSGGVRVLGEVVVDDKEGLLLIRLLVLDRWSSRRGPRRWYGKRGCRCG